MTYLALLLPVLVLPFLLALAAFEARCSDRTPLLRRRAVSDDADLAATPVPAAAETRR